MEGAIWPSLSGRGRGSLPPLPGEWPIWDVVFALLAKHMFLMHASSSEAFEAEQGEHPSLLALFVELQDSLPVTSLPFNVQTIVLY